MTAEQISKLIIEEWKKNRNNTPFVERALCSLVAQAIQSERDAAQKLVEALDDLFKIEPLDEDVSGHYEDCSLADDEGLGCNCGIHDAWSNAHKKLAAYKEATGEGGRE